MERTCIGHAAKGNKYAIFQGNYSDYEQTSTDLSISDNTHEKKRRGITDMANGYRQCLTVKIISLLPITILNSTAKIHSRKVVLERSDENRRAHSAV